MPPDPEQTSLEDIRRFVKLEQWRNSANRSAFGKINATPEQRRTRNNAEDVLAGLDAIERYAPKKGAHVVPSELVEALKAALELLAPRGETVERVGALLDQMQASIGIDPAKLGGGSTSASEAFREHHAQSAHAQAAAARRTRRSR